MFPYPADISAHNDTLLKLRVRNTKHAVKRERRIYYSQGTTVRVSSRGGGEEASPQIAQLPPLKTYVSPFFLLEQSEVNITKMKSPNYLATHYLSYRFHVFEWVTIVAN